MFFLKMYVAAPSLGAQALSRRLSQCAGRQSEAQFQFEVINVLESPERAVADNVMATPTIIRESPWPPVRLTGNFNDIDGVFRRLGLSFGDTPKCAESVR